MAAGATGSGSLGFFPGTRSTAVGRGFQGTGETGRAFRAVNAAARIRGRPGEGFAHPTAAEGRGESGGQRGPAGGAAGDREREHRVDGARAVVDAGTRLRRRGAL